MYGTVHAVGARGAPRGAGRFGRLGCFGRLQTAILTHICIVTLQHNDEHHCVAPIKYHSFYLWCLGLVTTVSPTVIIQMHYDGKHCAAPTKHRSVYLWCLGRDTTVSPTGMCNANQTPLCLPMVLRADTTVSPTSMLDYDDTHCVAPIKHHSV